MVIIGTPYNATHWLDLITLKMSSKRRRKSCVDSTKYYASERMAKPPGESYLGNHQCHKKVSKLSLSQTLYLNADILPFLPQQTPPNKMVRYTHVIVSIGTPQRI